jgi:hypothetical protein
MQRFAIMFRVRPGTEETVQHLLSTYESPEQVIDDDNRLVSTSVFMKEGLIVRMIEIEGSLPRLMAHMAQDANIQYVERELDKYLVEEDRRDTSTPAGAREFFSRALMQTVTTRISTPDGEVKL